MNKEEIIQRSEGLKQKPFGDDLIKEISQLLDEIANSVSKGVIKGLDFSDVSEAYHHWLGFLAANHIPIVDYPVSLILLHPRFKNS